MKTSSNSRVKGVERSVEGVERSVEGSVEGSVEEIAAESQFEK